MEQAILTPHQHAVLEQASRDSRITDRYYFTGGTALSEFYLHHRISEDLDFFTESDINLNELADFFTDITSVCAISKIETRPHRGLTLYFLTFTDQTQLKIDFVNFPFTQIEHGTKYHDLTVDSIFDIALNKFYVMSDRIRPRDFIDLYQILHTQGVSLEQVIARMNEKFHPFNYEDYLETTKRILRITDVDDNDYPTMLIPFDKEKMVSFFLSETKKMGKKIFK